MKIKFNFNKVVGSLVLAFIAWLCVGAPKFWK